MNTISVTAFGQEGSFARNIQENPQIAIDQIRAAKDAIRYVLDRVQTDSDFRWVMMHTESMDRLVTAEAIILGVQKESHKESRQEDVRPANRPEPTIKRLRRRVEQLVSAMERNGISVPEETESGS